MTLPSPPGQSVLAVVAVVVGVVAIVSIVIMIGLVPADHPVFVGQWFW